MARVVVIGGGIAGCAIAARLAGAGHEITVLEQEFEYSDKVRGEGLVNWGVLEAQAMGLGEVLLGAPGASVMTRYVGYDETVSIERARRTAKDLAGVIDGVPGLIGIGHPQFRQALADHAAKAGVEIVVGISSVHAEPGPQPSVSYAVDGAERRIAADLVVVADGKGSGTRRALGVALQTTTHRMMLTGMLIDDGGVWDRAETAVGVVGRDQLFVIPRGDGRIRLYVGRLVGDERFNGADRQQRFLECFRTEHFPDSDALADATVAGPIASFPMTDSWTEDPVLPGVVLAGDAAGWSNPITGQGLAVALRDARVITDLLLESATWTSGTLVPYREERRERMARLRFASALTDLITAFGTDDRAARRERAGRLLRTRPDLAAAFEAVHGGPWSLPGEAFSPDKLMTLALA